MLASSDKQKIEQYIDKLIDKLKAGAEKDLKNHVENKFVLDNLVKATVGKLTPESKSILSSVYNMMMDQTFAGELYKDPEMKAAFYELDFFKEINGKFNFEVPSQIDYEESKSLVNKWAEAGVVVVAGGLISVSLKSWIPVGVAAVIAVLMILLFGDDGIKLPGTGDKQNEDIHSVIDKYFENVKTTLMDWVSSVEKYYDQRISDLEGGMK